PFVDSSSSHHEAERRPNRQLCRLAASYRTSTIPKLRTVLRIQNRGGRAHRGSSARTRVRYPRQCHRTRAPRVLSRSFRTYRRMPLSAAMRSHPRWSTDSGGECEGTQTIHVHAPTSSNWTDIPRMPRGCEWSIAPWGLRHKAAEGYGSSHL